MSDPGPAVLNLLDEPVESSVMVRSQPLEEVREGTRKLIAQFLLGALAVVALAWTAVGIWGDAGDIGAAGAALDKIFTGVLGLAGTVVGFFFGAASAQGQAVRGR